ncbi:MAG: hypothetical protein PHI12_06565 [Dehalococcoidales bacterium]|nr:hypothetical protein [Dehalococcoidales bacterium]
MELAKYYCPADGVELKLSEVQYHNKIVCQTWECTNGHVWDIFHPVGSDLSFLHVEVITCECGKRIPKRIGRSWEKDTICQDCHDKKAAAWRMDPEQSSAVLEIQPLISETTRYYQLSTHIAIRPYPNPLMYGGMYGGDTVKDENEVDAAIARFNNIVENLKANGMTKIQIVRQPEKVVQSQMPMITVKAETQSAIQPKQVKMI